MRTREEYEDLLQSLLSKMLPNINSSDIRPAHQWEDGFAGKNQFSKVKGDKLTGFTNKDIFIYFKVDFDDELTEAFVDEEDNGLIKRDVNLTVNIYGEDCQNVSLKLIVYFRTNFALQYLNGLGLYLTSTPTSINGLHEEINEQWWERCDVNVKFNEMVCIDPIEKLKGVAKSGIVFIYGKQEKEIEVEFKPLEIIEGGK